MLKMKGDYGTKRKIKFELPNLDSIISELKSKKFYRYKGQIDFYLNLQDVTERNPFVRSLLKRSPIELHTKITFKDFKAYLNKEKDSSVYDDDFFLALRNNDQILLIENFGEFWYHQGQIFSLPSFKI